jgi:RNA-directed DNA polymerase
LAKQWAKKIPRRHDKLFAGIANFQALHAAARRAVKGKRKKPGAASFFANLEGETLALERQLRTGEYRPGRYVAFEVNDPKRRIVSAGPFRDRVVHHALCAIVEPISRRASSTTALPIGPAGGRIRLLRPMSVIATATPTFCGATSTAIFRRSAIRS